MKPSSYTRQLPLITSMVAIVVVCFTTATAESFAAIPASKVLLRQKFAPNHRDTLVSKLRRITGLAQLRFEEDGSLKLASESHQRGSIGARSLLISAVNGPDIIVLEDASSRSDVAFCRVVPGEDFSTRDVKVKTYVVLIDFTDFEQLMGDDKARESFDVGWGLMHELNHVVNDTEDSESADQLGQCEKHINVMREELGLPLRSSYFYRPTILRTNPNFRTTFVSLSFEQRNFSTGKTRTLLLTWDAAVVGGLTSNSATASVRLGS